MILPASAGQSFSFAIAFETPEAACGVMVYPFLNSAADEVKRIIELFN
jgi:hypothetical protein